MRLLEMRTLAWLPAIVPAIAFSLDQSAGICRVVVVVCVCALAKSDFSVSLAHSALVFLCRVIGGASSLGKQSGRPVLAEALAARGTQEKASNSIHISSEIKGEFALNVDIPFLSFCARQSKLQEAK
jgi:hypothetical protein